MNFYEWLKCDPTLPPYCDLHRDWFGTPTAGDTYTFSVRRVSSSSPGVNCLNGVSFCLQMLSNGVDINDTGFDSQSAWSTSIAQFSGEAYYPGSDIPGNSSNKTFIHNISEMDNGSVVTEAWSRSLVSNCTAYYQFGNPNSPTTYTDFNIWTNPSTHNPNCGS